MKPDISKKTKHWFKQNNWTIFDFQTQAWGAWHNGESGLIHSPTGSGKTLAAWLGPIQAAAQSDLPPEGLQVLWITPLRALANDTRKNLQNASDAHELKIDVQIRTGDTSSSVRNRQREKPPFALITTPESLSLLLSYTESKRTFAALTTIIVDEWHELLGSKRGVQLELCLARLRTANPNLRIWGLSATLGNLSVAMQTLLGPENQGTLITGVQPRQIEIKTLLPKNLKHFPWSGHLGLTLVKPVINVIDQAKTTLLFTNTRSQAELWFQALLTARPDWLMSIALHHGSIDRNLRVDIETRLRDGQLNCVVCTSSLDLGVDFSPVDQVIQVGSPKGVARLMQRAGRSGHQPGAVSRILCVPAHAFELVEIAAARRAMDAGDIESREPLVLSLDVLCQHLVTIALGIGFTQVAMLKEVRSTHAFAQLNQQQWHWVLDFITRGGQALQGYPQYHKVVEITGVYRVMNEQISKKHRMSIGTISSDASMFVAFRGGKKLGTIEESFIARLNPGDVFQFSGRKLELIKTRDMTAYVKNTTKRSRWIPRWNGTRLPLSTQLADSVLKTLHAWQKGFSDDIELKAIDTLLRAQMEWSSLPTPDNFVIELCKTTDTYSLFCFPFAGRLAHEGLAMLVASRITEKQSATFTLSANDYGFELQSPEPITISVDSLREALTTDNLMDDILNAINTSEITKRQFRDIARISGLIFEGYPGRGKSSKQVQASSSLIYEVLENYDSDNQLLHQAEREVLEAQLEYRRIESVLVRLQSQEWVLHETSQLTPLSFPLWAESLQSQTISSESFQSRITRMLAKLESTVKDAVSD